MAVLPVYKILLLPDANIYLRTERFEAATGRLPRPDEKVTLLMLKEDLPKEEIRSDSFYSVGVSGYVSEIHEEGWFAVRTRGRVNLEEAAVLFEGRIDAYTSRREDSDALSPQEDARKTAAVKNALIEFSKGTQWEGGSKAWISQFSTLNEVACACAVWMDASNEERYAILAEDSAVKRAEMLEKLIYETLEMGRLSQEGSSARQEDYQKMVRESAIRKQMEYLQNELDEMHPESVSDIRRLEVKIQESGMNETARREAEKILNRLKQEGTNGSETGMLYNYLDFVTSLSWKKEPAGEIDLDEAGRILEEDHVMNHRYK